MSKDQRSKKPREYRRRCPSCCKPMFATYGDAVLDGKKVRDAVMLWKCLTCGEEIARGSEPHITLHRERLSDGWIWIARNEQWDVTVEGQTKKEARQNALRSIAAEIAIKRES